MINKVKNTKLPKLSFVDTNSLYRYVNEFVISYIEEEVKDKVAVALKKKIDPIKMMFDSLLSEQSAENLFEEEIKRQEGKAKSNKIGFFHQNIFNLFGRGWTVPKQGFDVVNEKKKIFVEMKNKFNTMNDSSSRDTFLKLEKQMKKDQENLCFLVEIIATRHQNKPWEKTINGNKKNYDRLRRISIDYFYEMVTGKKNAFFDLCQVLPSYIQRTIKDQKKLILNFSSQYKINTEKFNSNNFIDTLLEKAFGSYNGWKKN